MDKPKIKSQLLSILFAAGKPVLISELKQILQIDEIQLREIIEDIVGQNSNAGIILLAHNDKLQLATHPDNSSIVKQFLSLELRERLTDAAVETLAVIAYRQPISRAEIENIRGVNSQYILRQLLIRGLIEKAESAADRRVQLYRTTLEFMQHLGLRDMKELPDFEELTKNIQLPANPN